MNNRDDEPRIVVFCCNWAIYPGLQLSRMAPDAAAPLYATIVTMCAGRVSPELVLEAFSRGACGVLVAGCPPGECDHDGNYDARRRMALLRKALEQFGIEPGRLAVEWVSAGESAKLEKIAGAFSDRIAEMGPIPALGTCSELRNG